MKRILLVCIILVVYLLSSFLLIRYVEDDVIRRLVAKLIPLVIVVFSIASSKLVMKVSFKRGLVTASALVSAVLLTVWSISQFEVFEDLHWGPIVLHVSNNLVTSLFEEGLFRVILFIGLIQAMEHSRLPGWTVIGLTALLFAAVHLSNLWRLEVGLIGVVTQMVFAFGIGVFFQVLYLVSRNIMIPVALHFLVNFLGTTNRLNSERAQVVENVSPDVSSLAFLLIFCSALIVISMLLYRKEAFDYYRKSVFRLQ